MSALLYSFGVNRVGRNIVAQMPVFASDNLEDIAAEERISTHDEPASFGLRILQSIDMSNRYISHIYSCELR